MKNSEIRYLGDLQRLDIKPGDKFVLKTPHPVSQDVADRIRKMWEIFVGEGVPLLMLDSACELGVISVDKD